jgi:hypothetical protein
LVRWRAGTDTANAPRILAAFFLLAAVSTPPIPPLGWKFVRSGTGKRDAVRDCHRIARVFVDRNELIFGIGLDELGVILVSSPRITQIAEMAACSMTLAASSGAAHPQGSVWPGGLAWLVSQQPD